MQLRARLTAATARLRQVIQHTRCPASLSIVSSFRYTKAQLKSYYHLPACSFVPVSVPCQISMC